MGADRRGPLAAFVVIAIVAAVLLVTTVRSQAAHRWLDPTRLPATVVAVPVVEPHLWEAVAHGANQVVQAGAVLARRTATTPSARDQGGASLALAPSTAVVEDTETNDAGEPATRHHDTDTRTHVSTDPHAPEAAPHPDDAAPVRDDEPLPRTGAPPAPRSPPGGHDHGRHLGWGHGHGRGYGHGHGKHSRTEAGHRGHGHLG